MDIARQVHRLLWNPHLHLEWQELYGFIVSGGKREVRDNTLRLRQMTESKL